MTIVHIIWSDSAAGSLKHALKNANRQDEVLPFFDDLSVGPLFSENSAVGLQARNQYINWEDDDYLQGMLAFLDYDFSTVEKVVIWHADNASDKLMLYLTCSLLLEKNFKGEVTENYFSNEHCWQFEHFFIIGVLSPEKMQAFLDKATALNTIQLQSYAENWFLWKDSNSTLRIFKDNAVIAVAEDFYDELLLSYCTSEFQCCARIVGYGLGYSEYIVGDNFLFDRIRFLVQSGVLEADNDDLTRMRHFSVRLTKT